MIFYVISPELKITRHPRNMTVFQKQRCSLHCEATGVYRVTWFHNNRMMARKGINYRITRTGKLRYNEINVQDRGMYHCEVEDGSEFHISKKAYVTVHGELEYLIIFLGVACEVGSGRVGSIHILGDLSALHCVWLIIITIAMLYKILANQSSCYN